MNVTKLNFLQRITKIIFILALVSFLLWKVTTCLHKYNENPTYTTTKLVNQNDADLPAITICPRNRNIGYKKSVLKNHGIKRQEYYSNNACSSNLTWSSNNTAISENDLFDQVTLNFDELVDCIYIGHFNGPQVNSKLYYKIL